MVQNRKYYDLFQLVIYNTILENLNDEYIEGTPLSLFNIGQKLITRKIGCPQNFGRMNKHVWDLSIKPSTITGFNKFFILYVKWFKKRVVTFYQCTPTI